MIKLLATTFSILMLSQLFYPLVSVAQVPDMTLQSQLYNKGRPASGELGQVQEIYAWKNFMFVSWMDSDGDFWLDSWNLINPASPAFVAGKAYGNIFDNIDALIPDAQLKAPRDMKVVNGRLIIWSRFVPRVFDILNDGSLANELQLSMGDTLNQGIQRLNWGGAYSASLRRMISDKQFMDGLAAGHTIDEMARLQSDYALVNFENPRAPFDMGGMRSIGKQYLAFETPVNGAIEGIPALLNVQAGKLGIDVQRMEPNHLPFLNTFWMPKIPSIFTQSSFNLSLNGIITKVVAELNPRRLHAKLMAKLERNFSRRLDLTLEKLVSKKFSSRVELSRVLATYKINADESFSRALQRIIEAQIGAALVTSSATEVLTPALSGWRKLTFAMEDKSLADLRSKLTQVFNTEISTAGLAQYLVKHLLSPLVGNPEYLNYTLADLLNGISGSAAGQVIDAALGVFHAVLPIAWLDLPNCMQVPDSSKDLFDIMFVQAGPRLETNELALLQILKAVRFYQGDADFGAFLNELDAKIKQLHDKLAADILRVFSGPLDTAINLQTKLGDAVTGFKSSIRPMEVLSAPLGQAIEYYLRNAGVDPTLTVRDVLKANKLYVDRFDLPAKGKLAKVADLIRAMKKRRLDRITLRAVFSVSKRIRVSTSALASHRVVRVPKGVTLDALEASIRQPLTALFKDMFGSISLDKTLIQAIEQYLTARIDAAIVGNLTSDLLNAALSRLKPNTTLPGVVGDIQLANQGDCIAKWKLAINTAIALAQSLHNEVVVLALASAQEQLSIAVEKVIDYALRSVLHDFLQQIFVGAGESFSSWTAGLKLTTSQVEFASLIPFKPEIVDTFAWQDALVIVPRNVNYMGAVAGANKSLSVFVFGATTGTLKSKLELGEWETIDKVRQFENYLLIEGNRKESSGNRHLFFLIDFVKDPQHPNLITSTAANSMAGYEQFAVFNQGKNIAVRSAAGVFVLRR